MDQSMSLKARAVRRLGTTLVVLAAMLLLTAGSLRFWEGWVFLAMMTGFWIFFFVDLLKHDPQLLERRLQAKETEPQQMLIQRMMSTSMISAFILAGLDFRFGWSREWLGPVPIALVVAGQAAVVAAYWLVFWVMKTNSFAGSTIRVEKEQKVIHGGPYALVRHPMYLGMAGMALGAPLALGSYIALPVFALLVPVLIYRLIHEEKTLRRDLPGYAEYCERTGFRLVPWVW